MISTISLCLGINSVGVGFDSLTGMKWDANLSLLIKMSIPRPLALSKNNSFPLPSPFQMNNSIAD